MDWHDATQTNVVDKLFYFLTGLGHEAVMVFFVLSGYFVGGSVAAAWQRSRWSWQSYAINRATRLELVLLPALVFTCLLDGLGTWMSHGIGYDASFSEFLASGPTPERPIDHRSSTFFANALFLQTILTPVFGTNGPLWSLANEFWYYVLFPLAMQTIFGRGSARWVTGMFFILIAGWLPIDILLPGMIWLFGFGAWWINEHSRPGGLLRSRAWLLVSAALFLVTLIGSKAILWGGWSYLTGLTFACLVAAVANRDQQALLTTKTNLLAEMSYTLYVTHFPALAFTWFVFLAPQQMNPGIRGYSTFSALVIMNRPGIPGDSIS